MARSTSDPYHPLLSLTVHELRSPVNVVGGYLNMLQRDGDPPLSGRQRVMVDEAEKSCARIMALVTELAEISRLDAGLVTLAREELDVFSLVADVAGRVREARDRDVQLAPGGENGGAQIHGDPARLRTAFDALFRAVLRETAGPCTMVADRRRDTIDGRTCAVIVVAEAGSVHAAHDAAPGVFDEKRAGLGLALPLARRIIEGHDGRIWSPSAAAGGDALRGSVIIALPIS
jgi:signal transduction histidine kinase